MIYKLTVSALILGASFLTVSGCAVDGATGANDDGAAEEAAATQDELNASAARLVGAFRDTGESVRPPTFEGIVFQQNGEFVADIDTGIRCITTPCPSAVRIAGRFTATHNFIRFSAPAGGDEQGTSFYGQYRYTLTNDKLWLGRLGPADHSWSNTLVKAPSYCGEPTDCAGQALLHPMCVGSWSCGAQRSCGWECGVPVPTAAIWPADKKTLVAENAGGGFTAPPAPGSTCAVGAAKYSLDIATRKLTWAECDFTDWSTPMHLVNGARTLTAAELASVDAAMNAVTLAGNDMCGADKPFLSLKVTSASQGTRTYADSFYACMGGTQKYVDNIDGVFGAFRELAHP